MLFAKNTIQAHNFLTEDKSLQGQPNPSSNWLEAISIDLIIISSIWLLILTFKRGLTGAVFLP